MTYSKIGKFGLAIADYTQAIHLDLNDVEAFYNRGLAYQKKGEAEKAEADFKKAQELDPSLKLP